ncbi:tetratricopeptide repeat protein [Streptomyces coelicoflavus]|uniref:serine/threonine-protein kinase n=1 Tax=Streptomyces coelicoflavus TaxID=285562 RepID=UPI003809CD2A
MEPLRAGDPERVGGFVLRGRLGAGGMGEVFLGRSPGGRSVAVKMVYPHLAGQREFRARFAVEVAAAEAVGGAFTAPVVAAGPEDDPPWIATAYIPGPDLAEAVAEAGPLPERSVWGLAAGLAEALQAIHAKGLLHRDLKPANVLLAADGPRVIDFGIARTLEGTALTSTGMIIGTVGFMSPEQAQGGRVGPAGDVFSLGVVLAYAAGGIEPFGQGQPWAILHRVVNEEPRLDAVHGPLHDLAAACLAKSPDERPTLPQVLDRITAHWDPPDDASDTSLWPAGVTTLIQQRSTTPTAPYTQLSDPVHDAPTTIGPAPENELTRRFEEALRISMGRPAEAVEFFAEVAADHAQVLGPDHPDTLLCRHEEAHNLGLVGVRLEAVELFADVAADRARVLGPDHPDTLRSRYYRAHYLGEAGRYLKAARLLAGVAADRARVLGPDHPDTFRSRFYRARYLGEAGRYLKAARLFAQLAADQERVLGPDHPDTLLSHHDHARFLSRSRRPRW